MSSLIDTGCRYAKIKGMKKRIMVAIMLVVIFTTALYFASPVGAETPREGGYGYGYSAAAAGLPK